MTTSGFYLSDLTYAPNWVIAPGFQLLRSAKDSYTYPVEGWYWFDSLELAAAFFDVPVPEHFNAGTDFGAENAPRWNGLYQALLGSEVYQYLLQLSVQFPLVDNALDKIIVSILYGKGEGASSIALDGFQSAVKLLFRVLELVDQVLAAEHLEEVRGALDSNGFESIALGP